MQLSTNAYSEGQILMDQILGPCHPPWETNIEFMVPGFTLAQTWLLQLFGQWMEALVSIHSFSFSFSLPSFAVTLLFK